MLAGCCAEQLMGHQLPMLVGQQLPKTLLQHKWRPAAQPRNASEAGELCFALQQQLSAWWGNDLPRWGLRHCKSSPFERTICLCAPESASERLERQ